MLKDADAEVSNFSGGALPYVKEFVERPTLAEALAALPKLNKAPKPTAAEKEQGLESVPLLGTSSVFWHFGRHCFPGAPGWHTSASVSACTGKMPGAPATAILDAY